ncbi:hypothetical protein [Streptomyces sp. SGAir0957]
MRHARLSVIVPVSDVEPHLDTCLSSLAADFRAAFCDLDDGRAAGRVMGRMAERNGGAA